MKKHIKKLWLKELRSGRYSQGKDALVKEHENQPTQFCCLGILTNLYVEETGDAMVWERTKTTLDEAVVKWAGLNSDDPEIEPDQIMGYRLASYKNDVEEKNFLEIADMIEKNL
jgi:hypothetical protein